MFFCRCVFTWFSPNLFCQKIRMVTSRTARKADVNDEVDRRVFLQFQCLLYIGTNHSALESPCAIFHRHQAFSSCSLHELCQLVDCPVVPGGKLEHVLDPYQAERPEVREHALDELRTDL